MLSKNHDVNNETARAQEFQKKIESLSKYGSHSDSEIYWVLMDMMQLKVEKNIEMILEGCKKNKNAEASLKRILSDSFFSPLQKAIETNNVAMINQLMKFGSVEEQIKSCSASAVLTLLANDQEELVLEFLRFGTDPNTKGLYGESLSALMLKNKKDTLFSSYVEKYESVIDFKTTSNEKRTLLHHAAMGGNLNAVEILLEKGLDVNKKDMYGYAALDYALFNGNMEVAKKLSNLSENEIEQDPRYNNRPPEIDHRNIVFNFLKLLQIKHLEKNDPDVLLKMPQIKEGVCNGWSFLAALKAAESDDGSPRMVGSDSPLQEHYRLSDLLGRWDGHAESLKSITDIFRDEPITLDKLFTQFNSDVYWFFQQDSAASGISRHDRKKQLELVSDKLRIEPLVDFGLSDLSEKELEVVLEAYRPIANQTIVDERSKGHDCCYYQNSNGYVQYFDPNNHFELPTQENYPAILDDTKFMRHQAHGVAYFHTCPEKIDNDLKKKIKEITDDLIKKLILENPSRRENASNILRHAVHYGYPFLLKRILSHPELSKQLDPKVIQGAADLAAIRNTFECLYVLYQHGLDLTTLNNRILEGLLRTAIQFDDPKMHQEVKKALKTWHKKRDGERTQTQRALMAFKFPTIEEKKPKSKSKDKNKKTTVAQSKKK